MAVEETKQADFGRAFADFLGRSTSDALEAVGGFLSGTLNWTAAQLAGPDRIPNADREKLAEQLQSAGTELAEAGAKDRGSLPDVFRHTGEAFHSAVNGLGLGAKNLQKSLFENIALSSIFGQSFVGVPVSSIVASFRLPSDGAEGADLRGRDVSVDEVARDFSASGRATPIFCIPGLFCDENMWAEKPGPQSLIELFAELDYYPVFFRFNPGAHISDNGRALARMMFEFLEHPDIDGRKPAVITYSQGGLVLRSALYYSREDGRPLGGRIGRAMLVGSPDGGSYIEKIGFWLGTGLQFAPMLSFNAMGLLLRTLGAVGFLTNQRSNAMKDLSHGIIREEDWKGSAQIRRYIKQKYFGELDDVDAYLIYSLVSRKRGHWSEWLGDGIVEEPSLSMLADEVYRKKSDPDSRVIVMYGRSHFQVMNSAKLRRIIRRLLAA